MVYLPKARTVESEKQPLLARGSEITFVSRHRLSKHVPATTDKYVTINLLLEKIFSTQFVQKGNMEDNSGNRVSSVREFVRKRGSWKVSAVQSGLKHGSRRVVMLETVTRKLLVKTL
jgi:hypothetical protein